MDSASSILSRDGGPFIVRVLVRALVRALALALALSLALPPTGARAQAAPRERRGADSARRKTRRRDESPPPARRGWTVHSDNDLFAFTHLDRDYTAGVSVTLTDTFAPYAGAPSRRTGPVAARALELGLLLFTPQDLAAEGPLPDDRPYASLVYASRSKLAHAPSRDVAYQTTLTVGLLGLRFAEQVHRSVHAAVGAVQPMGYGHQISAGGEPTFRYAASRYRLIGSGLLAHRPFALRFDLGASAGYVTGASADLAFRWGSRRAEWWESFSEDGDYAGQPVIDVPRPAARARHATFQLSAGLEVRARLYDTFLQGQFRHSDVAYSSSDVEHLLYEAWLGVDVALGNRLRIGYVLRHQSRELRRGRGARGFTWAGLSVTRDF